ncbi:hypothetical protein BDN70DRAFT_880933 [Pholiota conissans]|uniref:Uncharacterized protein n=1 Tax=Pholiota conissans TaxID=109636 RepID=A0A9P5YZS2_9AGAR|nr:hypothetical protein BDN70DRAFT_880933 [Pholiota conissans]
MHCISPLAVTISPECPGYETASNLQNVRHSRATRVVFIWFARPSAILPFRFPKASYAVIFDITSVPNYRSFDLAHTLLTFCEYHMRESGYIRFQIVYVVYAMHAGGTTGIILLDKRFRHAYEAQVSHSFSSDISVVAPLTHHLNVGNHPISIWNHDFSISRMNAHIDALCRNARRLARN